MRITFKAKPKQVFNMDDTPAYEYINVPELTRKHCDMSQARVHPKYGPYANSDLFPGVLSRIRKDIFGGAVLRLDRVPNGVKVDTSGFLTIVTFRV